MSTFDSELKYMKALYECKNDEYADAYKKAAAGMGVSPEFILLSRMAEKLFRLMNIMHHGGRPIEREEYIDVAVQAVLCAMESHRPAAQGIAPSDGGGYAPLLRDDGTLVSG